MDLRGCKSEFNEASANSADSCMNHQLTAEFSIAQHELVMDRLRTVDRNIGFARARLPKMRWSIFGSISAVSLRFRSAPEPT